MRDMLVRLQTISEEQEDYKIEYEVDNKPKPNVDTQSLSQEAIIFENTSAIEDFLTKADSIHKEIYLLQLEVKHLSHHNEHFATCVSRFTLLKKDSDTIARKIKQHGEVVYNQIQDLRIDSEELEKKEGAHSAASRIAWIQYNALLQEFKGAMDDYNKAEEMQRLKCRERIQRQASILGKEINNEQLDELVEKGGEGWAELTHDLHPPNLGSCRIALCDIKSRHRELVELEARLKEVHELFLDMAKLVEEQGILLNNIEFTVSNTVAYTGDVNSNLIRAHRYKKKNPFLQCCPCLPCWGQTAF